VSNKQNIYS